jgi:hypothetical protein
VQLDTSYECHDSIQFQDAGDMGAGIINVVERLESEYLSSLEVKTLDHLFCNFGPHLLFTFWGKRRVLVSSDEFPAHNMAFLSVPVIWCCVALGPNFTYWIDTFPPFCVGFICKAIRQDIQGTLSFVHKPAARLLKLHESFYTIWEYDIF